MPIAVMLPRALTPYTRGLATVTIHESCRTVRDALVALTAHWPALTDRVLTEQGELRRHVNVFVGDESIGFIDGLDSRVGEGTTITIVPAISGG